MSQIPRPPSQEHTAEYSFRYGQGIGPEDGYVPPSTDTVTLPIPIATNLMPPPAPGRELPGEVIDTTFTPSDRASLVADRITNGETPRAIVPAFLKLRAIMAGVRERKAQLRLEALAEHQEAINYIGVSILRNNNTFAGPDSIRRPSTPAQIEDYAKLRQINDQKRKLVGHSHDLWQRTNPNVSSHHPMNDDGTYDPKRIKNHGLLNGPVNASPQEESKRKRLNSRHRRLLTHQEHLDHEFKTIITAPAKEAVQVKSQRDRNAVKRDVFIAAHKEQAQKRAERREAIVKNVKAGVAKIPGSGKRAVTRIRTKASSRRNPPATPPNITTL